VVWKTLGEDGPPVVNVNGPRYGALLTPTALLGFNNIELITDRPLQTNLEEIRAVKRNWPDRALVVSLMVPCRKKAPGRPSCRWSKTPAATASSSTSAARTA
jgi:dihydropyrimidine dehydrogenase (NAD+) subunit PreA